MNKILVIGDVHGKFDILIKYIKNAIQEHGTFSHIIQLGDFGYWPDDIKFKTLTPFFKDFLEEIRIPFLWIDGNHEDHSVLQSITSKNEKEFIKTHNNYLSTYAFYKKRGSYMTIENKILFFIGGAKSIDRLTRTLMYDYFLDEEITREQSHEILQAAEKLLKEKKDIYIFTHTIPFDEKIDSIFRIYKKETTWHNKFLYEILMNLKPVKWYHGHFHMDFDYKLPGFDTEFYSVDLVDKKKFGYRILEI